MISPLWVELDDDGCVLRASDSVRHELMPLFGADLGLPLRVAVRTDLRAALARRAGRVRVGLGHGAVRGQFNLDVTEGSRGAHVALTKAVEVSPGELLASAAEGGSDGVLITDADVQVVWVNPAFCRMVGYAADEIVGRSMSVFRSPAVHDRALLAMTRALLGKDSWTGESIFRRSDGVEFPVRLAVTGMRSDSERMTHFVVSVADLSDQAVQAHLESLDASAELLHRLALGFAHDVNNLSSELLVLAEQVAGGRAHELLALSSQLDRVASSFGDVGRQLLTLSGEELTRTPTDLSQAVGDLAWLITRASARTRPVSVMLPDLPLFVTVPSASMLRAVLFLALRAVSELPPERVVDITARAEDGRGLLCFSYEADTTERERLRSMLPEGPVSARAGQLLQLRAMSAGVELSLETDQSGRVVICASAPLAATPSPKARAAESAEVPRRRRALVVEDNDALRELVSQSIEASFDEVLTAADGQDGLDALTRIDGEVDIIVADLMMPRVHGLDFLRRAREQWPSLKVVVVTGAATSHLTAQARALGAVALLAKPFRIRELRAVIQDALDTDA